VLAVGPRLSPVNGAGLAGHPGPLESDLLAVAFHYELLEIGRESSHVVLVRQHRHGLGPQEVVVPDAEQGHQHRQVLLEGGSPEVLVHPVKTAEHGPEVVGAHRQHG